MAVAALRWFKAALVLQLLLLGYWLTMEVVELYPWNDLPARPADYPLGRSIAIHALQLIAYTLLFAFGQRALATLSLIGYAGYAAFQVWTGWKPFALGADSVYQSYYAEYFSKTLKIIPAFGTHIPPDAQHIVLQLLAILTFAATAMAVARMQHL